MMVSHAIKPVYQVFSHASINNDEFAFVPAVLGYYSDSKTGHLISQPFNSSTPVLYYNKDAFKQAGLNPEQPPKTWQQLAADAVKLREAGLACGYANGGYQGVAQFLHFLAEPEIVAEWHQQTGYLPVTTAGYTLSKQQGYYDHNPGAAIVIRQMMNKPLLLLPGGHLWENLHHVWSQGVSGQAAPFSRLLLNSLIMELGITIGKNGVSLLSAYSIVYFRFPLRNLVFWLIFMTLMLPVEVRIFPTVDVISHLHLLDSYTGLTLPLMASATATFLFRQFFMTVPHELLESARIDGAGPLRFLWDILLPLSKTNLAALFVITFIYGWNQYLWPLLIINDASLGTAVAGIQSMIASGDGTTQWNQVMAAMLLTLIAPVAIVLVMQRAYHSNPEHSGDFDLAKMGSGSANAIQVMSEAMKYAYADRSQYLGDPDFVSVPVQALISKAYAKTLAQSIDLNHARPSSAIRPWQLQPYESDQTTHYSVVDKNGFAVAVTYTLNTYFGSGIMAGNSGILLNNEMDDFSAKPGSPNILGLIGADANAIAPRKRPLSFMSPTLVVKDGKIWLVTGSPGGSHIITTVLQMVVNTIDFGMNIAEATEAPRFHQQWTPDKLRLEKGFSPNTLRLLREKGQPIAIKPVMGSVQSIMRLPDGTLAGASDPRTQDDLTAGY